MKFEIDGVLVSGSSNALPKIKFSTPTPLISNQLYLSSKSLSAWINLFPFIVLEQSNEPSAWKIMVFDGLKIDRTAKAITGEESIRYIDISSGQRNFVPTSKPTAKALPVFMTVL